MTICIHPKNPRPTKSEVLAKLSSYGTITHITLSPILLCVYVKFAYPPDEDRVISQWNYNKLGGWPTVFSIEYSDTTFTPEDAVNSNYSPSLSYPSSTSLPQPTSSSKPSTSSSEPTKGQIITGILVGIGVITFIAVISGFPVGIVITVGLAGLGVAISFNQS
ncbi:hypothetical protein [Anabaena sp. UHCC 0451]|uniref:hypothetical protein n=1 Tax=Anabaena sp. UHCC 0451 TaxID=2055235 RepID=UPI002B21CF21|nr:hypothetical protein [Anabaena sp. UHCC 0451]MEA5577600.1 hypothetical protein [Anabaena sp. UHCC 0451]